MPHWSGLLTPTEVTQKVAAYTTQALGLKIDYYIMLIKGMQDTNPAQREITTREVVDINVERFFRLQLGYTVTHSTTGQPTGMTLMTKIA